MLNRFHIYSGKKSQSTMQSSKSSISTVNRGNPEKDSIETIESKISPFKEKSTGNQKHVEEEKPDVDELIENVDAEDNCDNDIDDNNKNTSGHNSDSEAEFATSDEESEASSYVQETKEGDKEDKKETEDKTNFQEKKDVSLSPREKDLSFLSTEEKVNIWLPKAQTNGRDIQISIDESQKLALLAKLNEIDSDNAVAEATDSDHKTTAVEKRVQVAESYNNQQNRKNNLMADLFGEEPFIGRRKNTFTIESKPLKTSMRTSLSGTSKTVKFLEDSQF